MQRYRPGADTPRLATYKSVHSQHEDEIWFRMEVLKALKNARAWIAWLGVYAIIQAAAVPVLMLVLIGAGQQP